MASKPLFFTSRDEWFAYYWPDEFLREWHANLAPADMGRVMAADAMREVSRG